MAGTITEYSSGLTATAGLRGICLGPDGNIWFTENTQNKVGKITSGGTITEYSIPTGTGPYGICSDGTNLWVACNSNNYVVKVTTGGSFTEYSLGSSKGPQGICLGPDGNLWCTFNTASSIAKITTGGSVTEYATTTGSAGPFMIASDGTNLWTTLRTANKICKTTTAGSHTEYSISSGTTNNAFGICRGPDGNMWFSQQQSGVNKIASVTSGGTITEYSTGTAEPRGIVAYRGELWVVHGSGNKIARYDTSGSEIASYSITTAASSSFFIATGNSDDTLWFTESSGNKVSSITGPGYPTFTADGVIQAAGTKIFSADGVVLATQTRTLTADGAIAPITPTLSLAVDYYGRVTGTISGAYGQSVAIYRSSDNSTWTDITANCTVTGLTSFVDKRPQYGSQPITLGSTGYYKVTVTAGTSSATSSVQSATVDVDRTNVELAEWSVIHSEMATQATRENSSHLGYAVPAPWVLSAAYVAAFHPSKTSEALTDLDTWWTFIKTQINADGLLDSLYRSGYFYSADQTEFIVYAMATARILRERLGGNATAVALAADIVSVCNTLGKALVDNFARYSKTFAPPPSTFPRPASATAWSSTSAVVTNAVRVPTGGSPTRIYRNIDAHSDAVTGGSEPTWPITTRGLVSDGTAIWQEATQDIPQWSATASISKGAIRQPTTYNGRSYRALNAGITGSTQPTWPTTPGDTVTDNGITWKETSYTGSMFAQVYDQVGFLYPVYGSANASMVGDDLARAAAAFAVLYTDPDATDFYTGGSYRSSALALIHDTLSLGATLQVGDGALQQDGTGYAAYDTNYASFTLHLTAVCVKQLGSSFDSTTDPTVASALSWLTSNYSTEPTISNGGELGTPATSIQRVEILRRAAAYTVNGTSNTLGDGIAYSSAFWPSSVYSQTGQASSSFAADSNFLAAIGIKWAFITSTTQTFTADARIAGTRSFTADAVVRGAQTVTADAVIQNLVAFTYTQTVTADAVIRDPTVTKTVTADAIVLSQTAKTVTADAVIVASVTVTQVTRSIGADAIVSVDGDGTVTTRVGYWLSRRRSKMETKKSYFKLLSTGTTRTTSYSSGTLEADVEPGVVVFLDVTAASGTGGLTVRINAVDGASGKEIALNTAPTAVTGTGQYSYAVYPFGAISGNLTQSTSGYLPTQFSITVTAGDSSSYTYSLGYCLLP